MQTAEQHGRNDPSPAEPEETIHSAQKRNRTRRAVRNGIFALITAAAAAALIATLALPIYRIYGNSMSPTLNKGDIVMTIRGANEKPGGLVVFYYNNRILIRRVIAGAGDQVDIDSSGNVFVNGELVQEPYLTGKSYGNCSITLPYQVPEGTVFVLCDNRDNSLDSRNASIGCIPKEQIVGRLAFRIWPFGKPALLR